MLHILEAQQFTKSFLEKIFEGTEYYLTQKRSSRMAGQIMASLFYEPSTRTRLSFESAFLRLGGSVIGTENAKEFSSSVKGESLEDSIRVIGQYCDVIVLRHFEDDAAKRASKVSPVSIISAGCGAGQHPTQALLDIFTIHQHFKKIDGLHITMVGDLKNGRTVRSLAYLLGLYNDIHISFVAPHGLQIGMDIQNYLKRHDVDFDLCHSIDKVIETADVIYSTRTQIERQTEVFAFLPFMDFGLDEERVGKMKKDALILHPLPRNDEIDVEVDAYPQAGYFNQARNGLYVRMALLHQVV